ncbi:MAG TPA: VOC family protein [Candidatus Binatus sp.]|nr:VOC family protein [Candidatus Binatus sp.]
MAHFLGFDHIDTRVRSLTHAEPFYDRLMPELGLKVKRHSFVDEAGEWHDLKPGQKHNVVEYFEEPVPDRATFFIGFIEDPAMKPTRTRIAFRADSPAQLKRWEEFLREIGARNIEPSASMTDYPAIFFEDPAGTMLEIVARVPRDLPSP